MIKRMKRILKRMLQTAYDRSLPPPSSDEMAFLSQLKAVFRELPEMDTTSVLPSEAAWFRNMNRLRELVLKQDPRNFLRWDVVSRTMFVSSASYIPTELKYLKRHNDWNTRWRSAINESSVGHPLPYIFYPASSGNLIHHAYHVAQFENKTPYKISDMEFVLEFGGGYGSMCRLFHNLGFRGKYVIFDLSSFSALQTYYLKTSGFEVLSLADSVKSNTGISCISDIEALRNVLEEQLQLKVANKMFVGTWSISESPMSLRAMVLSLVSDFHSFLIAYQDRFEEVDNLSYFGDWKENVDEVAWHSWQIDHLPRDNYLVGARNNERLK